MHSLTPQKIAVFNSLIDKADVVSIVTHVHPDGDAMGSGLAFKHYLEQVRRKKVFFWFEDNYSHGLDFLFTAGETEYIQSLRQDERKYRKAMQNADLLLCVDCSGMSRTGDIQKIFQGTKMPKVLIDHHLSPDAGSFDLCFSETEISSACELCLQVLKAMPDIDGDTAKLPMRCLTALLTGITTDTNNFANSVFPSTLTAVSELLACGVDRDKVLEHVYNEYPEGRLRLIGHLLDKGLTITPEGVAYMVLTRKMLRKFQIEEGDTQGIVNLPLAIKNVRVSILLREEIRQFRVSLRSKKGTSANRFAVEYFHGGGHENAAGGKLLIPRDIVFKGKASSYIEKSARAFFEKEDNQ